jgi:Uma2 family endonuclease
MPPPVSHSEHSEPHTDLVGWLVVYKSATPGVSTGDNGSLRLDLNNMPQPDAYMLIAPECGGQARIEDGYVAGGPELVGEVAASSVGLDLGLKLNVYQRTGVREYIVWRTRDRQLDYFISREGKFQPLSPNSGGTFRSEAFPGLWLHAPSLLAGDLADVLRRLHEGLKSPEHAAFVERLRASRDQR